MIIGNLKSEDFALKLLVVAIPWSYIVAKQTKGSSYIAAGIAHHRWSEKVIPYNWVAKIAFEFGYLEMALLCKSKWKQSSTSSNLKTAHTA